MLAADMQRTHYGRYTRLATFNSVRQYTAYEVSDFEACDNISGEGDAEASLFPQSQCQICRVGGWRKTQPVQHAYNVAWAYP